MAIDFRRATLKDADQIAELCGQLGYPATGDILRRRIAAFAGDDTQTILVAADESGRVFGWTQVVIRAALAEEAHAELEGLVVREGCRSEGVGGWLLAAAEQWAAGRGMRRMRVRSNVLRERAHGFYLRAGYLVAKHQAVFERSLTPSG